MIRDWESYTLPQTDRRIVAALAEALYRLPVQTGIEDDLRTEIVDGVQLWLGALQPVLRMGIRALLLSLELSPARFGFGLCTMSGMPLTLRGRYLAALEQADCPSQEVWKAIVGMVYFAHPAGAVHLDPLPVATVVQLRRLVRDPVGVGTPLGSPS